MNLTNIKYKTLTMFIAGSFLASCSVNNNSKYINIDNSYAQQESKNIRINYIPNIQLITNDDKLSNLIKESSNKKFNLSDENFAVLKLFIETTLVSDVLEKPTVKLVGILKKENRNFNYKTSYKLVDGIGNTITQGHVIGINNQSEGDIKLSKSSIEDASDQLIEKINNEVINTLIDFKIVSVSPQSVYISINEGIKLINNEVFLVNELPGTALNFSQIITNGKSSLAELKVITGEFPKVGMTVNLQK